MIARTGKAMMVPRFARVRRAARMLAAWTPAALQIAGGAAVPASLALAVAGCEDKGDPYRNPSLEGVVHLKPYEIQMTAKRLGLKKCDLHKKDPKLNMSENLTKRLEELGLNDLLTSTDAKILTVYLLDTVETYYAKNRGITAAQKHIETKLAEALKDNGQTSAVISHLFNKITKEGDSVPKVYDLLVPTGDISENADLSEGKKVEKQYDDFCVQSHRNTLKFLSLTLKTKDDDDFVKILNSVTTSKDKRAEAAKTAESPFAKMFDENVEYVAPSTGGVNLAGVLSLEPSEVTVGVETPVALKGFKFVPKDPAKAMVLGLKMAVKANSEGVVSLKGMLDNEEVIELNLNATAATTAELAETADPVTPPVIPPVTPPTKTPKEGIGDL